MDTRTKKILAAMSLLPAAGLATMHASAAFSQSPAEKSLGTWTFYHENVLGTSLQITIRAETPDAATKSEAAALATFDREDHILSAWKPDSEFARFSKTLYEPVPVSPELFSMLAAFDTWRDRTDGALDASVEAATRLWNQATTEGRLPTGEDIARTREAIAQPHWQLDPVHGTATRLSGTPLALASFAKSSISAKAADDALRAGAAGVMLNVGGDVVVRGAITQVVAIGDPNDSSATGLPLQHVVVSNRAVATSGGYQRGFTSAARAAAQPPSFSHLIDPRTAEPVSHVLSSTVIARDAETAGALATAFSVMPVAETERLATRMPDVDYMLLLPGGRQVTSPGWSRYARGARLENAAYVPPVKAVTGGWNTNFELAIELNLPRIDDARYRRPYVAAWIEDSDHFPVRTLALWFKNPRWLPELKQWYRDDQIRNLSEGTDISRTVSSATRPAGQYSLKWDGKDNEGKLVKPGKYTVVVEASREHGGYQLERHEMNFAGAPQQLTLPAGKELGTVLLDYRKR